MKNNRWNFGDYPNLLSDSLLYELQKGPSCLDHDVLSGINRWEKPAVRGENTYLKNYNIGQPLNQWQHLHGQRFWKFGFSKCFLAVIVLFLLNFTMLIFSD